MKGHQAERGKGDVELNLKAQWVDKQCQHIILVKQGSLF